jgi:hypothetical protein
MGMIAAVGVIFLVFFLLMYVQYKAPVELSDHHYHVALIKGIKRNGHRFLREHPNFIAEKNFAYPQLFHWLCSFLSEKYYRQRYVVINITVNVLIIISFLVGTQLFYVYQLEEKVSAELLLMLGLLFVCTPFTYAPWNARNVGISARSFGVLTGLWFNFALIYSYYFPSWVSYGVLTFCMVLVLLSSQFTGQYLILGLLPLAMLLEKYELLLFLMLAFCFCYLLMPTVFKKYVVGQYWHKRIFGKYLVESYVLSARPSIWMDFVRDIYKKIQQQKGASIYYILYQPLLYIFIGIPANVALFFLVLTMGSTEHVVMFKPFYALILTGLVLFLLTSFRRTRFLGEPERYVELSIPMAVFLVVQLSLVTGVAGKLWYVVAFSVVILAIQFLLLWRSNRNKSTSIKAKDLESIIELVVSHSQEQGTLLSNSWHAMRKFYATDIKTLTPVITAQYTGKFHISEIFKESFIYLSQDVLVELMEAFKLDYLILDTSHTTAQFQERMTKKYRLIGQKGDFCVYYAREEIKC